MNAVNGFMLYEIDISATHLNNEWRLFNGCY